MHLKRSSSFFSLSAQEKLLIVGVWLLLPLVLAPPLLWLFHHSRTLRSYRSITRNTSSSLALTSPAPRLTSMVNSGDTLPPLSAPMKILNFSPGRVFGFSSTPIACNGPRMDTSGCFLSQPPLRKGKYLPTTLFLSISVSETCRKCQHS